MLSKIAHEEKCCLCRQTSPVRISLSLTFIDYFSMFHMLRETIKESIWTDEDLLEGIPHLLLTESPDYTK